jgi:hypothetical protein
LSGPLPALGAHLMAAAIEYEASRAGEAPGLDASKVSRRRALRHVSGLRHARFSKVTTRQDP